MIWFEIKNLLKLTRAIHSEVFKLGITKVEMTWELSSKPSLLSLLNIIDPVEIWFVERIQWLQMSVMTLTNSNISQMETKVNNQSQPPTQTHMNSYLQISLPQIL